MEIEAPGSIKKWGNDQNVGTFRFRANRNAAQENTITWEWGGKSQLVFPPDGRRVIMNGDILKGKWKEIKGDVKVMWGKLTGDDLTRLEGNKDKLFGSLQQKYGYAKDIAGQGYKNLVHH